jgi:hypothetical protein
MEAEYLKVARNIYLHERMPADLKVCEKRPAVALLQLSPIIFYFQRLTATFLLVLCKSTRLDPCRHDPFNVVPGGPPCPARHLAVTRLRPLSLERLGRVGGEGHQLAHCPVYIGVNWRGTPEQCSFSSQMVMTAKICNCDLDGVCIYQLFMLEMSRESFALHQIGNWITTTLHPKPQAQLIYTFQSPQR